MNLKLGKLRLRSLFCSSPPPDGLLFARRIVGIGRVVIPGIVVMGHFFFFFAPVFGHPSASAAASTGRVMRCRLIRPLHASGLQTTWNASQHFAAHDSAG